MLLADAAGAGAGPLREGQQPLQVLQEFEDQLLGEPRGGHHGVGVIQEEGGEEDDEGEEGEDFEGPSHGHHFCFADEASQ